MDNVEVPVDTLLRSSTDGNYQFRRISNFKQYSTHITMTDASPGIYGHALGTLDASQVKQLARMDAQLDKLTELVQDLLDVSKIGAGKLTYTMAEIDIEVLVRETVEDLQRLADRHEIIVEGEARSKVTADPERIRQVLTNLITNAVKYSPDAHKVIVGLKSEGSDVEKSEADVVPGEITVWVQDFGVGIPRSEQEKIFDRFYQVNDVSRRSRDTYPGLGLGLYISSEIVKRHGGKIWVECEADEGSTFYFTLPLQKPRARKMIAHALTG